MVVNHSTVNAFCAFILETLRKWKLQMRIANFFVLKPVSFSFEYIFSRKDVNLCWFSLDYKNLKWTIFFFGRFQGRNQ